MKFLIITLVIIITAVGVAALFVSRRNAASPPKMYHIAIITRKDVATYTQAIESYRKKMVTLGYAEGKNISYEIHEFGNSSELKDIVQAVVRSGPDVIHTYSTPATVQAYQQTKTMPHPIPVVFGSMGDPLAAKVVLDLQQPGTNVTGVASLATELTANRVRFLKEINPNIKRIAMPRSAASLNDVSANKSVEVAQETAKQLGLELIFFPVSSAEENATIAKSITKEKAEGMIVGGDSLVWGGIDAYIAQAIKEKIPFAAFDLTQIAKGALIGMGPDYARVGEQAAGLTHQVLDGTPPATIPVQVPQKLILAVNIATARAIGITLSDDLLKRADVVIGK